MKSCSVFKRMIFFPFINQRYIFMETETRYEANRHCCFFLALSNLTGKVHLIFCLSGHAVTSKYAWIAMSLIHVINIYCRIFPIENAVCSIYSSFIHKKFHYMMVFGKNHLQFFFLWYYIISNIMKLVRIIEVQYNILSVE